MVMVCCMFSVGFKDCGVGVEGWKGYVLIEVVVFR